MVTSACNGCSELACGAGTLLTSVWKSGWRSVPSSARSRVAVLARAEKIVEAEKKLKNPVSITVAEYTFNGRPCRRFDIFADRPHPTRYCHQAVLFIDTATNLPVRFEAYDQPKLGEATGELIEVISFVNVKTNVGLGDAAFDK